MSSDQVGVEHVAISADIDLSALPEHVALRTAQGALVILIGTAHISEQSCRDVTTIIQAVKPQQVLVELCPARVAIIDPDHIGKLYKAWKQQREASSTSSHAEPSSSHSGEGETNPNEASHEAVQRKRGEEGANASDANLAESSARTRSRSNSLERQGAGEVKEDGRLKTLKGALDRQGGILAVAISYMYESISNQVKLHVGDDMRTAAEEAAKMGATIVLGDRPIGITLARAWGGLSSWQKLKLGYELLRVSFSSIKSEDLELLKNKDILTDLITELSVKYPSLYTHLLQERDLYLAHKLRLLPGPVAVGVVGLGHVEGIKRHWNDQIDIPSIMTQPPSSSWKSFFVKLSLVVLLIIGAIGSILYILLWK